MGRHFGFPCERLSYPAMIATTDNYVRDRTGEMLGLLRSEAGIHYFALYVAGSEYSTA